MPTPPMRKTVAVQGVRKHAPLTVAIVTFPSWSSEAGWLMEELHSIKLPHSPIVNLDPYIDGPPDEVQFCGRFVMANPRIVHAVMKMVGVSSCTSRGNTRVFLRTSSHPVPSHIVGQKEAEMLNGLSVTIGNVKTPIFKAWHCPCHGMSGADIETLVDKISRFLGEVRVDGSRRSLPVEETAGWRMTQQTEPPTNMTADEFNTESYHCLKHLQDFSNIVQAAIPAVMAWWEVGEHHLVPGEIEVRWM